MNPVAACSIFFKNIVCNTPKFSTNQLGSISPTTFLSVFRLFSCIVFSKNDKRIFNGAQSCRSKHCLNNICARSNSPAVLDRKSCPAHNSRINNPTITSLL
ncbi:hypothetical protein AX774_g6112 [Zancudomyces culisetae]|uniref:Uncharacterized protein n=1 Tax=Zancudomyces culisetae TaxID=1213189 RepID=A0A1R1PHI2_ZANCU|nr:hypothetical protein AX774_g6112 [Zancudomyces culisetae]|eukprot:OMH80455.1 hypothetical protein AX774_g6112 [Zancudomyces culisetae]